MSKRILIAEDDLTTKELLASFAIKHGYDVIAVNNGVDLLNVIAEEKFDVIVTDLMMPHLDGASAAEIMKMQGNTTPVIAITGVSPNDMDLSKDKFIKVFHKPVNIRHVFEYVESLTGKPSINPITISSHSPLGTITEGLEACCNISLSPCLRK